MAGRAISQDQLNRLFTAALEAAIGRIEKDGYFHPLVFELRANGTIQAVVVLETGAVDNSREPIDRLIELLHKRARDGMIDATAIALSADEQLAIHLRASNYSTDIRILFSVETTGVIKRRRRLSLGEFTARIAGNDIFGEKA